jgi:hypothetical protein
MGIVYDPELYRATEKHFAPMKMPAWSKHSFQTWHTDAVFDNGYYATAMFSFTGPLYTVLLQIVDASGAIVVESMVFFEEDDVVYAKEGYDINLGENYFRSHFPNLVIHIRDDENKAGADLLVEFLVMPTISELPDGIGIGRAKTPNMPIQVAWFFMPWNKITGTLIVDGKEILVSGHGWSDHQFGTDDFFGKACSYFYWADFPLGEHTISLFEAQGTAEQGYRSIKWLWDFKGDKIYSYDRDADFYIYATEIDDGDTVPKKLTYVFEGDRIRGKVTCKWKTLIQKQPVEWPTGKAMLNRSAYDCHAEQSIDGEKIDKSFVRILEAAYTLDPVRTFGAEPFVSPFGAGPSTDTTAKTSGAEAQAQNTEPEAVIEEDVVFIDESIVSKFSIKSKLGKVMKDPDGLAVLEKFVPGISKDPNTRLGYGMTLKMLFSMPQTGVTKAVLAKIDQALREIK